MLFDPESSITSPIELAWYYSLFTKSSQQYKKQKKLNCKDEWTRWMHTYIAHRNVKKTSCKLLFEKFAGFKKWVALLIGFNRNVGFVKEKMSLKTLISFDKIVITVQFWYQRS